MYYSNDIIEDVRSRVDIVDLISGYVKLTKRGMNHIGLCPFHTEKTPSFSVSQSKQIFCCFGCKAAGNAFTFLMKYENMGFIEALKVLADKAGVALPEMSDEKSRRFADQRTKLFEIHREAGLFYHQELMGEKGRHALAYLKERGLSDTIIRTFGLGYSPKSMSRLYEVLKKKGYDDEILKSSGLFSYKDDKRPSDRFWNRVMFPIIDHAGKVIAFGGRVMGEGGPKYLNSPDTPVFIKGRNLFSLNFAKTSKEPYLIICEGYMDVISLYQGGFSNAVASLGTALTPDQARLLAKYTKTVILMYDSDDAGIRAAQKAIPILKTAGLIVKVANLKPYKDPDDFMKSLGVGELAGRIRDAVGSFEFELQLGEKEYNLQVPEERLHLILKMAEKLIDIENTLERENYLSLLASKYNLSPEVLRDKVNEIALQKEIRGDYSETANRMKATKEIKGESGLLKAERLFISLLTDCPELYPKIKAWIYPEDFSTSVAKDIVRGIYAQLERGERNPAVLISKYETEEEQQEAAVLFGENTLVDKEENAFRKIVSETLLVIKRASLERQMLEATEGGNMTKLMELMEEQKKISAMKIEL